MSLKTFLFVTFFCVFILTLNAQRNYGGYNHLGINGGISIYNITTPNFETESGTGFVAGFTTRGEFYGSFDILYGISFSNSELGIKASNALNTQFVDYQIQGVQLNVLGSYNIIRNHLSIEAGPVLNVNGKMNLKSESFEDYIIDGYTTIRTQDIQDISTFNVHAVGGIMAGIENVRLSAHYQYGINNVFNSLNDKNLEESNFKGNSSNVVLAIYVYF